MASSSAAPPGDAPGHPGIPPTWSSSAKDAVGSTLGSSRIWFTLGFGIVNEVYYPHVDRPQIRDLGFIVADGKGFWVEVKRLASYTLETPGPGIPAYTLTHTHARFSLALRVCPDPKRDALLVDAVLTGDDDLRLYALLAPHADGSGYDNTAWIAAQTRWRALAARRGTTTMTLLAVDPEGRDAWQRTSCGYVGVSDGWQDFARNGAMTWTYPQAGPGNVALMGELPRRARLALAFNESAEDAMVHGAGSLVGTFGETWQRHIDQWRRWHEWRRSQITSEQALPESLRREAAISGMVLKAHQDAVYAGASVASLSIPWGQDRDDRGGYHLVWARDLVETAGALLAIGAREDARDILRYLVATQQSDGHWFQNQWLNGTPYWQGIQLDETGFPILLAEALRERNALGDVAVGEMVRRAASFIAREGPVTGQDRWEEDAGLNPFTLAVCVAALVCAARYLDDPAHTYALELADHWNAQIEQWTYVTQSPLAERFGVDGYYVRTAPPEALDTRAALCSTVPLKNRPDGENSAEADEVVGLEFLELVRLGLRKADDPRIVSSVTVADALLRVDLPTGPAWRRYPGDGYGEHEDGSAFDGTGTGRPWPLLTGERGHYALAAGEDPIPYARAMAAMTSRGGMIPEQVWDQPAIPERFLYPGRPTGSAMPLVWAHAEFLKLGASCALGHAFDRPTAVWERYGGEAPASARETWRFNCKTSSVERGKVLRIELQAPATVRYTTDAWASGQDVATRDTGLGIHLVDLATGTLEPGDEIVFTFQWTASGAWEGCDFAVRVTDPGGS
ncbi:MAG TPA: glycoside hydrolase family 15 protein [Candidatus Dormibacteraeota bacterium]|nr:glycoside hydrolase family 15 protein [Candidatus Dormibacteraeota bacterium]